VYWVTCCECRPGVRRRASKAESALPMTPFDAMDMQQFWKLIEDARRQVPDPADGEEVAARAAALLSAYSREEIVAAGQVLRELMAGSYRTPLWAAAYVINGGCSDDGFEYFRGWLILQGREVFEHVVADPDALADLPLVRAQTPGAACLECEDTLYIASRAYRAATGEELPPHPFPDPAPEAGSRMGLRLRRSNRNEAATAPAGRTLLGLTWPAVFVEQVTGNRTRTISMEICAVRAAMPPDLRDRVSASDRERPSLQG